MSAINVEKSIDVRDVGCPYPLITTTKNINTVSVGGILEVMATDPAAIENISRWAQRSGHQVVEVVTEEGGYFRIYVKRGGSQT